MWVFSGLPGGRGGGIGEEDRSEGEIESVELAPKMTFDSLATPFYYLHVGVWARPGISVCKDKKDHGSRHS